MAQVSHQYMTTGKNIVWMDLCQQGDVSAFQYKIIVIQLLSCVQLFAIP